MRKFAESTVEEATLEWLRELGYETRFGLTSRRGKLHQEKLDRINRIYRMIRQKSC